MRLKCPHDPSAFRLTVYDTDLLVAETLPHDHKRFVSAATNNKHRSSLLGSRGSFGDAIGRGRLHKQSE